MPDRKVQFVIPATETVEGAGVTVRRSLGLHKLRESDPFLLLDEFYSTGPEAKGGFPDHPHRGFSTLTYMLAGHMNHKDNKGNAGRVGPGGFQWMTAGAGIVHSEMPEPEKDGMRGLQLWVNLPAAEKMRAPFYINGEAKDVPEVKGQGFALRILAGVFDGKKGPIAPGPVGLTYFDAAIEKGAKLSLPTPAGHFAFVYVANGGVKVSEDPIKAGTAALLGEGETVRLGGLAGSSRLIVVAGRPLREPIARYGPFVMNTEGEIKQAILDFQAGRF
jgi:quercetin 2,3-dioxygenase